MNDHGRDGERGVALFLAVVAVIAFVGIAMSMITGSLATAREYESARAHAQRLYIAEAGISFARIDIENGGTGNLGTKDSPVKFGNGAYFVTASKDTDGNITILSVGTVKGASRALRSGFQEYGGVFFHAIFSGNSSGDPTYSMDLSGLQQEADLINGDIFSGGDVSVSEDAKITGTVRASGTVTGTEGIEGATQPIPDLQELNYEVNHDVNVSQEFTDHATYGSAATGGNAWQLPEDKASHIFRMNPSDRQTEFQSTTKDDFFLEDPYEIPSTSTTLDESGGTDITLSGIDGNPGPDGNKKVYYIDGNLWLHSKRTYSFQIEHLQPEGVQITFVVKGNIYFSDNLYLRSKNKDGLLFIALKDDSVADSGNIYFGDPAFGTLERMDAFMYAENNFYDQNLDEDGSTTVEVNGIMTAGNQVAIERDYQDHHTRLELNFDDRIKNGTLEIPGLPPLGGSKKRTEPLLREVGTIEIAVSEALGAN